MRPVNKPLPPTAFVEEALAAPGGKPDPLTSIRMQLEATIGYYCSFCELPIHVTQAVASKATRKLKRTPTVQQWSDLLLACDYCQFHRTRDVSNLSDYLWPDVDVTFTLTNTSPFLYALKDVTYVVNPDSPAEIPVSSTQPMVIVSANPQSSNHAKAQRTIDLFQLNTPFYDAGTNTYTISESQLMARLDPRVDLRTRAWDSAAAAIATLRQMQSITAYPQVFDTAVAMTAALAQSCGFWSTWMTSMWQAYPDQALVTRTLLEVSRLGAYQVVGFQTFPDGGRPPWTLFTGTALDRVTF